MTAGAAPSGSALSALAAAVEVLDARLTAVEALGPAQRRAALALLEPAVSHEQMFAARTMDERDPVEAAVRARRLAVERRLIDALWTVDREAALHAHARAVSASRAAVACAYFTTRDGLELLERELAAAWARSPGDLRIAAAGARALLAPDLVRGVDAIRGDARFAELVLRFDALVAKVRAALEPGARP